MWSCHIYTKKNYISCQLPYLWAWRPYDFKNFVQPVCGVDVADEWENLETRVHPILQNTELICLLLPCEEVVYIVVVLAGCDKHVSLTKNLFKIVKTVPSLWMFHHLWSLQLFQEVTDYLHMVDKLLAGLLVMANSLSCLHNHDDKLDGINPCKLCDVHFLSALLVASATELSSK